MNGRKKIYIQNTTTRINKYFLIRRQRLHPQPNILQYFLYSFSFHIFQIDFMYKNNIFFFFVMLFPYRDFLSILQSFFCVCLLYKITSFSSSSPSSSSSSSRVIYRPSKGNTYSPSICMRKWSEINGKKIKSWNMNKK